MLEPISDELMFRRLVGISLVLNQFSNPFTFTVSPCLGPVFLQVAREGCMIVECAQQRLNALNDGVQFPTK